MSLSVRSGNLRIGLQFLDGDGCTLCYNEHSYLYFDTEIIADGITAFCALF